MRFRFEPVHEADRLLTVVPDGSDQVVLDLSDVRFVKPALLVAVAALASAHLDRPGESPRFVPPSAHDPRVYASRMCLGEVLGDLGIGVSGLPQVRHRDRHERLCELTRFESSGDAARLTNLVQQRCQDNSMAFEIEDALTQAVWELAANCLEHSQVEHGFLAAQVLPKPRRALHFAVADGGIGIRESLVGTDHEHDDDKTAIMAATRRRVTSVDSQERGVGLPNLLQWTTKVGGTVTIRSGAAVITARARPDGEGIDTTTAVVDEIAGTLVSGHLPC